MPMNPEKTKTQDAKSNRIRKRTLEKSSEKTIFDVVISTSSF